MDTFIIPFPDVEQEERETAAELHGFFASHGIRQPDRVINMLWMDDAVRKDEHVDHPFPKQRSGKWSGAYVICDQRDKGQHPLVLYAGMTVNLAIRLQQHMCNPTHSCFGDYWERLWAGEWGEPAAEGTPVGCPVAAVWFIDDKRARRQFEHVLIGLLNPVLNVL